MQECYTWIIRGGGGRGNFCSARDRTWAGYIHGKSLSGPGILLYLGLLVKVSQDKRDFEKSKTAILHDSTRHVRMVPSSLIVEIVIIVIEI